MEIDPQAGVIDFSEGDAELLLSKLGDFLEANEEQDGYFKLNGELYAVNAIYEKDEDGKGKHIEVLVSHVHTAKGETVPEMLGMGVYRNDEEGNLIYAPFLDDDKLLNPKAWALALSMERLTCGFITEERADDTSRK